MKPKENLKGLSLYILHNGHMADGGDGMYEKRDWYLWIV